MENIVTFPTPVQSTKRSRTPMAPPSLGMEGSALPFSEADDAVMSSGRPPSMTELYHQESERCSCKKIMVYHCFVSSFGDIGG